MKTNEFVLPEKWYVFYPKEEYKTIVKFLNWKNKPTTKEGYLSTHDNESYGLSPLNLYKGYTEITFEQFKEHVLKDIPKPEYDPKDVAFKQRTVIGYKLIKPEYKESVRLICKAETILSANHFVNITYQAGSPFVQKLEEAGVMHWFEEIYEKELITLKSGVKLSEEDIAEVKEILKNKGYEV